MVLVGVAKAMLMTSYALGMAVSFRLFGEDCQLCQ
jgi:hypothetical protein